MKFYVTSMGFQNDPEFKLKFEFNFFVNLNFETLKNIGFEKNGGGLQIIKVGKIWGIIRNDTNTCDR